MYNPHFQINQSKAHAKHIYSHNRTNNNSPTSCLSSASACSSFFVGRKAIQTNQSVYGNRANLENIKQTMLNTETVQFV